MSAPALDYAYHYREPSQFDRPAGALKLATFSQAEESEPCFFTGRLLRPKRTAELLRALMKVVQTRFHIPPAMLEKVLALADPVVTSNDGRLRFEAFSGCCGVYARVDLLPAAVEGPIAGRGTTNVDFNQPMLSALATIRDTDGVSLHVGSDQVALTKNSETVVEKKVQLPVRWLKGFVEVQVCQSRMERRLEVSGAEASRFLRSLPRMKTNRRETRVVPAGRGLRLSQRDAPGAVVVGGLERLRVLEGLADRAQTLRVFADPVTAASAWVLDFDDCRFHLVISPEVWRGFSGEGQALESLASADEPCALTEVRAALRWQSVLDAGTLAARSGTAMNEIERALAILGTRGLVGFDLSEGNWFHRELPFDFDRIESLQPRWKSARKLIAEGRVRIGRRSKTEVELFVTGSGVEHRVRISGDAAKCSCPWYARHGTSRGPCRHVLAAGLYLEETPDE